VVSSKASQTSVITTEKVFHPESFDIDEKGSREIVANKRMGMYPWTH
jgi:hypothetical protein